MVRVADDAMEVGISLSIEYAQDPVPLEFLVMHGQHAIILKFDIAMKEPWTWESAQFAVHAISLPLPKLNVSSGRLDLFDVCC